MFFLLFLDTIESNNPTNFSNLSETWMDRFNVSANLLTILFGEKAIFHAGRNAKSLTTFSLPVSSDRGGEISVEGIVYRSRATNPPLFT